MLSTGRRTEDSDKVGDYMSHALMNSENTFAIALEESEIEIRLEETTRQLIHHLIKLYLYPDVIKYKAHEWRYEVYTILHNVCRIRGTKQFPTADLIIDNTYRLNEDLIFIWAKHIQEDRDIDQGRGRCRSYDHDILRRSIYEYYVWLANELSLYGEVSRKSAYEKMRKLEFGVI